MSIKKIVPIFPEISKTLLKNHFIEKGFCYSILSLYSLKWCEALYWKLPSTYSPQLLHTHYIFCKEIWNVKMRIFKLSETLILKPLDTIHFLVLSCPRIVLYSRKPFLCLCKIQWCVLFRTSIVEFVLKKWMKCKILSQGHVNLASKWV